MKIVNKIVLSLASFLMASPTLAAQTDGDTTPVSDVPRIEGIGAILDRIVALIFPVAGIVCVIFIIIGGYMWIASAGDPSKTKQAQGTLTWAIIGLVFILLAAGIVTLIVNFIEK